MRETKFRAWDKLNNRMLYPKWDEGKGLFIYGIYTIRTTPPNKDIFSHPSEFVGGESSLSWIIKKPEFIELQFTGLKDKNGKEICEGDILKFVILKGQEKTNLNALTVTVEWTNASWGFRHTHPELQHEDDKIWTSFWQSEDGELWEKDYFEVIGSIYENPELLKS